MKYRIVMWASAGFLVAGFWAVYAFATMPTTLFVEPELMALIQLTCPVVAAGFYFHFGVSLYRSLVANAVTYAVVGLIVESLRQHKYVGLNSELHR
jgi:hypothetical protein